ncbi:ABC transporter ATP-binding protein [Hahella ganghwensis]|uniref:ABC transporter ATP-binding protein n=1 Tax=Hahella ganghwensis TaxID=286420 RepID=UPI0003652F52|nr:ABC transporter ATP-binding protein [Hahella ganghwensis]
MSVSLEFDSVAYRIGQKTLVSDLSLTFPAGSISAVIGPNGSGKSTFLKLASRLLSPSQGNIQLGEKPLKHYRQRELSRQLALLPQSAPRPLGMLIEDLVACGRHPHRSVLGRLSQHDQEMIDWALQLVDLADRRKERVDVLSGGEMQRVWLAMILAQDTPIILLDEPTSYLDLSHQFELLELVQDINRQLNKSIVWILHDINQALQFSHQILLMKKGSPAFFGTPEQLLELPLLDETFQLHTTRVELPDGNTYLHCRSNNYRPRQVSNSGKPSLEKVRCD